jgi:hypothetical protein
MYPVIALVGLTVFMWVVAMWATLEESEETHVVEKPEQSPGEHDHRKAA